MESILFKLGIPTYRMPIFTPFTTAAQLQIQLPKEMPSQIGWIYGLSTSTEGVTPDNQPLLSNAQAALLYLYLKAGQTTFVEAIRLDELVFDPTTGVDMRYYPVNIPSEISLDASYIQNPTGILAAPTLFFMLHLHYIDLKSYKYLIEKGYIGKNGIFNSK